MNARHILGMPRHSGTGCRGKRFLISHRVCGEHGLRNVYFIHLFVVSVYLLSYISFFRGGGGVKHRISDFFLASGEFEAVLGFFFSFFCIECLKLS